MSRVAHRTFSSPLRASVRLQLNAVTRSSRAALTRRMMGSESHASHASSSSDRPWIIGSALVFGPLFLYLVSPSARKDPHGHTSHGHKNHRHEEGHVQHVDPHHAEATKPIADDEGTEVSGEEVKESMEKAFAADSPKDAQEREELVAQAEMTTDGESSAAGGHIQTDESTGATPTPDSEVDGTLSASIEDVEVKSGTNDEKVGGSARDESELSTESKA